MTTLLQRPLWSRLALAATLVLACGTGIALAGPAAPKAASSLPGTKMAWVLVSDWTTRYGRTSVDISPPMPTYEACKAFLESIHLVEREANPGEKFEDSKCVSFPMATP
jgi:hypothetical protein